MKTPILITFLLLVISTTIFANNTPETIKLDKPNLNREGSFMEVLSKRKSSRTFSDKAISKSDMSDLLWAANGINREDGKRTAPSAKNLQEIDIYLFIKEGVYIYDFKNHALKLIIKGDYRKLIAGRQESISKAPLSLLYVADLNKLSSFPKEQIIITAALDTGLISQNVNLFCAAANLSNVPRTTMDKKGIINLLKLPTEKVPLLNNVIGYNK